MAVVGSAGLDNNNNKNNDNTGLRDYSSSPSSSSAAATSKQKSTNNTATLLSPPNTLAERRKFVVQQQQHAAPKINKHDIITEKSVVTVNDDDHDPSDDSSIRQQHSLLNKNTYSRVLSTPINDDNGGQSNFYRRTSSFDLLGRGNQNARTSVSDASSSSSSSFLHHPPRRAVFQRANTIYNCSLAHAAAAPTAPIPLTDTLILNMGASTSRNFFGSSSQTLYNGTTLHRRAGALPPLTEQNNENSLKDSTASSYDTVAVLIDSVNRRNAFDININNNKRQSDPLFFDDSADAARRRRQSSLFVTHNVNNNNNGIGTTLTAGQSSFRSSLSAPSRMAGYHSERMERWYRERAYYQEQLIGHRRFIPRNRPNIWQIMTKSPLTLALTFGAVTGLSVLCTSLFYISMLCNWGVTSFSSTSSSSSSSSGAVFFEKFAPSTNVFSVAIDNVTHVRDKILSNQTFLPFLHATPSSTAPPGMLPNSHTFCQFQPFFSMGDVELGSNEKDAPAWILNCTVRSTPDRNSFDEHENRTLASILYSSLHQTQLFKATERQYLFLFRRVHSNLWRACDELSDAHRHHIASEMPDMFDMSRRQSLHACIPYLGPFTLWDKTLLSRTEIFEPNNKLIQFHQSACACGIIVCILYTVAVVIALVSIVIKHYCVLFLTNAFVYWLAALYTFFCISLYYYKMEYQRRLGTLPMVFEQLDWRLLAITGITPDDIKPLKHFKLDATAISVVWMSAVVSVLTGVSWWHLSDRMKYVMILKNWYLKVPTEKLHKSGSLVLIK